MITDGLGEGFIERHWRCAPLFLRGGAAHIVPHRVSPESFLDASQALERQSPELVFRDASAVVFAQKLERTHPELCAITRAARRSVAGVSVWFDGVWAEDGHGIGSHYDIADSFIVQQSGTKIWRLHDPSFLADEDVRARLLNETRVDTMYMPDSFVEYVLQPGDLLYVPMLWLHWGVSIGRSLSVSLALTSRNALQWLPAAIARAHRSCAPTPGRVRTLGQGGLVHRLQEPGFRDKVRSALEQELYGAHEPSGDGARTADADHLGREIVTLCTRVRDQPEWWRPVPVLWRGNGVYSPDGMSAPSAGHAHMDRLFAGLDEVLRGNPRIERKPSTSMAPSLPRELRRAPPPALYANPPAPMDWQSWLAMWRSGEWRGALVRFFDHVGWVSTRRMLLAIRSAFERIPRAASANRALDVLTAMARLEAAELRAMATSPELSSFTWHMARALEHGYVPRTVELMDWLPALARPFIQDLGALHTSEATVPNCDAPLIWLDSGERHPPPHIWRDWIERAWPRDALSGGLVHAPDAVAMMSPSRAHAAHLASSAEPSDELVAALVRDHVRGLGARAPGNTPAASTPWFRGILLLDAAKPQHWRDDMAREALRRLAYDVIDLAPVFQPSRRPGWYFPFLEPQTRPGLLRFHRWMVSVRLPDPGASLLSEPGTRDLERARLTQWGREFVECWTRIGHHAPEEGARMEAGP